MRHNLQQEGWGNYRAQELLCHAERSEGLRLDGRMNENVYVCKGRHIYIMCYDTSAQPSIAD